jgi:hypothetical protein
VATADVATGAGAAAAIGAAAIGATTAAPNSGMMYVSLIRMVVDR